MGPRWERNLGDDLDRLARESATRHLVCLLEEHELAALKIPDLVVQAREREIEVTSFAIVDGDVPADLNLLVGLVQRIRGWAASGSNVVIHCKAGLGRSGVVGGSVLIADGKTAAEAISILHRVRGPNSPENRRQEKFLESVERHFLAARPSAASRSPLVRAAQPPARESRVIGAILAAAIGDAMGHPTEFMKLSAIHQRWGPSGVQNFELFWEREGTRFAPYTDDTQMAEAVLRALLDAMSAGHDLDRTMRRIADAFVVWSTHPQGGHRAPGNACLAGCRALAAGSHWSEAGGPTAGGCGSVMRAYPFGLLFSHDLERAERWAVEHSKLTHRDPIALAACAAMAIGTALSLSRAAHEIVIAAMIAAARRYNAPTADMMQRAFDEAVSGVEPDVTLLRLQAWAAHEAIAAAVYVFARHPDDPRAAILEGANTDGDSDSIATLAGALVGARCGAEMIPQQWVEQVERSTELRALATQVAAS
jgi:ADP-ribosylglycohydrolase